MNEKELKQEIAKALAMGVKLKSELEAFKELFYDITEKTSPEQVEAYKQAAAKNLVKHERQIRDNLQVSDPELRIMFLREFYPYKEGF